MKRIFLALLVFAPLVSIAQAIIANPQNSTDEGGELVLKGSTSSINPWHLDNLSGNFRIFHSGTEYVRMTKDGYVGIGTTNPQAKLEVVRGGTIGGTWNPAGSFFTISDGGSQKIIMDSNEIYGSNTLHIGSQSGDIVKFRAVRPNSGTSDKMVIKADGKVGIGTASPSANLEISSTTSGDAILRIEADEDNNNENDNPLIEMRQDGDLVGANIGFSENFGENVFGIGMKNPGGGGNKWNTFTINTENEFIGIGTKNPREKLEISTGTTGDAVLRIEADTNNSNEANNARIELYQDGSLHGAFIGFDNGWAGNTTMPDNIFRIVTRSAGLNDYNNFTINPINRNVGIGTANPDAKLAVNGNIHTKEVKVDLQGWPDYVFEDTYNLPTLQQVEQHITEKGHLINIPSAAEVAKEGINLGEMNAKLLEKIEELTLYTIAQEKEIQRLLEIERRLAKIEKILNQEKI